MKALVCSCGVASASVIAFGPLSAKAQANFSGTWRLNVAASDLGQVKPPKSDVITIRQHGKRFAWSEVMVLQNGSVEKEAWHGSMDGKARSVEGVPGSKASYQPDGSGQWISPQGNSDLLATVSADGKQFIMTSTTKLPDGRTMKQKFTYDRAE